MSLFVGSTEFSGAYVGSSAVDAVYLGADKVWPLGVDWVLTTQKTATYDKFLPASWDTGYISQKLDTQGRWTGQTNDQWRVYFQRQIFPTDWTVRLYTRTDSANPDAGANKGWTSMQVRAPVADSGWSSRDQTWLRTDATFSTTSHTGYTEDVWEWEYINPVLPPFGDSVNFQDWKIRGTNTFITV